MGEILPGVAGGVFGFWVFFPLVALQNVLSGRGNWRAQVRKIPRNLLIVWTFFAFFRLMVFIWPMPIWSVFVPEPLGTVLFFAAGLVSLLLWVLVQRGGGVNASLPGSRLASSPTPGPTPTAAPSLTTTGSVPLCPHCGVPMVLRTAQRGQLQGKQFYGCPNFPRCREVVPL